jgi:hypothetical protein
MSERLGIPSTKYGPSVSCGVPLSTIDVGVSVHVLFVEAHFESQITLEMVQIVEAERAAVLSMFDLNLLLFVQETLESQQMKYTLRLGLHIG